MQLPLAGVHKLLTGDLLSLRDRLLNARKRGIGAPAECVAAEAGSELLLVGAHHWWGL